MAHKCGKRRRRHPGQLMKEKIGIIAKGRNMIIHEMGKCMVSPWRHSIVKLPYFWNALRQRCCWDIRILVVAMVKWLSYSPCKQGIINPTLQQSFSWDIKMRSLLHMTIVGSGTSNSNRSSQYLHIKCWISSKFSSFNYREWIHFVHLALFIMKGDNFPDFLLVF